MYARQVVEETDALGVLFSSAVIDTLEGSPPLCHSQGSVWGK